MINKSKCIPYRYSLQNNNQGKMFPKNIEEKESFNQSLESWNNHMRKVLNFYKETIKTINPVKFSQSILIKKIDNL